MSKVYQGLEGIELIEKINRQEVEKSKIEVVGYQTIDEANRKRQLKLHDWQADLLEDALDSVTNNPRADLMALGPQKTKFGSLISGPEIDPAQVLAQYEMTDLYLSDLEATIIKDYPHLRTKARMRRIKLFKDAKSLLVPFEEDFSKLSLKAKEILEETPELKIYREQFKHSKLSEKTFEGGLEKLGDSEVYLLRSDSSKVSDIGFKNPTQIKEIFNRLPMAHKLQDLLERLNAFIQSPEGKEKIGKIIAGLNYSAVDKKGLYKLLPESILSILRDLDKYYSGLERTLGHCINSIFKHKNDLRAAGPEFERAFIIDLLHAEGYALKEGKSFTTNSDLMVGFPFSQAVTNLWDPQISLVKFPKNSAKIQLSSDRYTTEYEVLVSEALKPDRIVSKFRPSDFSKIEMHTLDKDAYSEIEALEKKYQMKFRSISESRYVHPKLKRGQN